MSRTAKRVILTLEEHQSLETWVRGRNLPYRQVVRAKIITMAADFDLHLIVDNYGTRKHPRVKARLQRHPRFQLHFTPTSSSWLNLVEP